jgi:thiamine pyrophosphate-dependent acetolactate synthase large subunit-like protein
MGMPGMHGTVAAVGALQRSDLLIALGTRFDDRVTGQLSTFAPLAKIITPTSTRRRSPRTGSPTCRSSATPRT